VFAGFFAIMSPLATTPLAVPLLAGPGTIVAFSLQ
jgi:small neutral amino acid transporter SnatA (MarC family)